ncbi:MAG: hypothetical protein N2260_09355 [Syntrophobacterales bacterium]|nr:hypothetical protein [Syntrophobacterales bacterium]
MKRRVVFYFWVSIFTSLLMWNSVGFAQIETDGVLVNLSTRGYVGTGDNVMIAGFCVSDYLTLVIRALGPSLGARGVYGVLSDPRIDIYDSRGLLLVSNDDWQQYPTASILRQIGMAPSSPREAAILDTAPPGCYTVVVRGAGGSTGIALVEVYDITLFIL